jgi:hypothetical protein
MMENEEANTMKKLITLILAVVMAAVCACGAAEGTGSAEKTAFLRIREGVTAQVYDKPGSGNAVDSLAGGRICGLIDEGTTEAGAAWFHVFYLNSKREGAPGYINAKDAEQLTEEELKALMEDPDLLNEILDLVDALDAYLGAGSSGKKTTGSGAQPQNDFTALYQLAMKELQKLLDTNVSSGLDELQKKGEELADQAKEAGEKLIGDSKKAGEELINEAKKAGESLKDDLTKALESMDGKKADEAIDSLMDSVNEAIEKQTGKTDGKIRDALDQMSKTLKDLDVQIGESSGKAIDSFGSLIEDTQSFLNGADFAKVNEAMKDLGEKFKNGTFTEGAEGIGSFLDTLMQTFGTK